MGSLSNTVDGTSGTAISNANSAGPNQFNTVSVTGTGTTLTYDTAHVHAGSTAAKFSLAAISSTAYLDWSALPTTPSANVYVRFYAYLTALPSANTVLAKFLNGAAVESSIQLQTTGIVRTLNNAGGTLGSLTESFPLNQWVRVEFEVTGITTTTSTTVACRIFSGANLETSTPDTGGSVSTAGTSLSGTVTDLRVGTSSAVVETSTFTYWLDDIAYSDVATPGPQALALVRAAPLPLPPAVPVQQPRIVGVPAGAFTAVAALSGSGTLTASPVFAGTAALTGTGTLTVAAPGIAGLPVTQAVAQPPRPAPPPPGQIIGPAVLAVAGAASLTGSGTLTASPVFAGSAALTGSGTLTAAPSVGGPIGAIQAVRAQPGPAQPPPPQIIGSTPPAPPGTAALSGSGTLTAAPVFTGTATLTGSGTLTAAPAFTATAALSGTGTLSAAPVFAAAAALSGSGTLAAAPVFTAAATLSGSGTLTAVSTVTAPVPSVIIQAPAAPRAPPPPPSPQIIPAVQNQLFVVVVADMQPGGGVNPPPSVVGAQVAGLNPAPDLVLMPGDLANDGTTAQYGFFNTMYGSLLSRIFPVPGNHDWVPGNLTQYDTYFGSQDSPPHYFSFNTANGWHIIGLESDAAAVGAPNIGTTQYNWLAADLAANRGKPILAFWHHPRWSDGTNAADPGGTNDSVVMRDPWNLLRAYAADLVMVGHCHSYQRFPKWDANASADPLGIAEFVVGTGGSGLFTLNSTQRSVVNSYQAAAYDQLNSQWFGYLKLWLTESSYSWQFISQNAAGSQNPGAILDSGGPVPTNLSQGAVQPNVIATLSGSGTLTAAPVFAGTAALTGTGTLTVSAPGVAGLPVTRPVTQPAQPQPPPPAQIVGSAPPVFFAGAASLTGTGTLTASPVFAGTAALSGSGTLTAGPVFAGTASLSGSGTLTAAPVFSGTATLSGSGTLTASPVFAGSAALSGSGTLTVAAPGVAGLPVIQAVAQPPAPGRPARPQITGATLTAGTAGAAALSGSGTLTAAPSFAGAASLAGAGTLTAAPQFAGTASLTGAGTLAAGPVFAAAAALTGTGTLTAVTAQQAPAALTGAGTLSAAGTQPSSATLSGAGTLTAAPLNLPASRPGTVIAADWPASTVIAADWQAGTVAALDRPAGTVAAADWAAMTVQAFDRPAGTVGAADHP